MESIKSGRKPDLASNERTRALYEQLPHYPKPPVLKLPSATEMDEMLAFMGMPKGSLTFKINKLLLSLADFESFLNCPEEELDRMLRYTNLRSGALYSPVISASLALEDDSRSLSPLERAATLLTGLRRFYRDLMSGDFAPDTFRDSVLEMGQYPNFFSTCQIIENHQGRLYKSKDREHLTVLCRGKFFRVHLWPSVEDPSPQKIAALLTEIISRTQEEDNQATPALLTCASTPTQVRGFGRMEKIASNAASLQAIRDSFATLCLDLDVMPESYADTAMQCHVGNPENRWYHASLQLVVFGNARAGAICNFSTYLDGNTMMRGASEIRRRALESPMESKATPQSNSHFPITRLFWAVPEKLLQQARKEYEFVRDYQRATFTIEGIGRGMFQNYGIEAVPAFIVALEMTAFSLLQRHARITQFLALSRYCCMDLTTTNVTTDAVKRCVEYLLSQDCSTHQAKALLMDAIESQKQIIHQARHFLSLSDMLPIHVLNQKGLKRTWVTFLMNIRFFVIFLTGHIKQHSREIIVSHPEIYTGVPVIGRPGVRLPYVKYFGLHYQIYDDRIVITMMPGLNWSVPNEKLLAELEQNLGRITRLLQQDDRTTQSDHSHGEPDARSSPKTIQKNF